MKDRAGPSGGEARGGLGLASLTPRLRPPRRQTAEEREAERHRAGRLLLHLRPPLPPDPLCLHNSSLFALQNLQPWAEDNKVASVSGLASVV